MKKVTLASLVFVLVLSVGLTAQAVVDSEIYSTANGDFTTKFWKEKFIGGGHGAPGNILMAIGQGFVFQNAVLEKAEPRYDTTGNFVIGYKTTYTGGRLTLNSRGPWLNKKKYQVTDIEAINESTRDADGNLYFTLSFSGPDKKAGVWVDVTVSFVATAENYEIKYDEDGTLDFHRGFDFNADIEITEASDVLP
jgi:hypothetical protein